MQGLLDFIGGFFQSFQIFTIIADYERGVRLRCGRFVGVLEPGWHWMAPVVDEVLVDNVVQKRIEIGEQSLTTKDGKTILINVTITVVITDIKVALLEVEDLDTSVYETCHGCVTDMVMEHGWDELRDIDIADYLREECDEQCQELGVNVPRVRVRDLSVSRTLRVVQ